MTLQEHNSLNFTGKLVQALFFSTLCLIFILIFNGCKKQDEDSSAPEIHFQAPTSGSPYYYNYSFQAQAHITDNKKLQSVSLDIVNAGGQVLLQSESLQNLGTSYELSFTFYHNDLYLTTGTYYIRITASDGENTTIEFREIQLFAAPRTLDKIIAVRCGINGCTLDSLSGNQLSTFMNPDGDFEFGSIDSRINQFCWITSNPTGGLVWLYPDLLPRPGSDFSSLLYSDVTAFFHDQEHHEFYAGCLDGRLLKVTESLVQQYASFDGTKISHVLTSESFVYVMTQTAQSADTYIHVLNRSTGSLIQSLPVGFEIKGITLMENENKVLLAGNESGNSLFKFYNCNTNALNDVFNFYDNSIVHGLWPAGNGNFYITHEAGIGFYSGYLSNYVIQSSMIPQKMIYEDLQGVVYVLASDGIHLMNQDCSSQLAFVAATDMKDLWLKYNK